MGPDEVDAQSALEAAEHARLIAAGWPPALIKATFDEFDYACEVSGVGVIEFARAEDVGGGWVRLSNFDTGTGSGSGRPVPHCPCPRGIEVRVADIRWAADAPFGS